jgi:hypothetical protein
MRSLARLLALGLVASAAACSSSQGQNGGTESADGEKLIALVRMPTPALERCRSGNLLPACPALVPSARWRDRPEWSTQRGRIVFRGAYELAAGAEHPGHPRQDRPPRLVHLVVLGGHEAAAVGSEWAAARAGIAVQDGLYRRDRRRPLSFGQRTWAGRSGELLLAPPFPQGGIVGNHVVFRWRRGESNYVVTLHGWEPFSETVGVVRRLVESLPS